MDWARPPARPKEQPCRCGICPSTSSRSTCPTSPSLPTSTVYAAYNHYAGLFGAEPEKAMAIHAFNKHEGGATAQLAAHVRWLTERF